MLHVKRLFLWPSETLSSLVILNLLLFHILNLTGIGFSTLVDAELQTESVHSLKRVTVEWGLSNPQTTRIVPIRNRRSWALCLILFLSRSTSALSLSLPSSWAYVFFNSIIQLFHFIFMLLILFNRTKFTELALKKSLCVLDQLPTKFNSFHTEVMSLRMRIYLTQNGTNL